MQGRSEEELYHWVAEWQWKQRGGEEKRCGGMRLFSCSGVECGLSGLLELR